MSQKRAYHHGNLRAALLKGARAHIEREGVETLSVRALAREAGVAHRAAYQHFPDKNALLYEVFAAAYQRLEARVKRETNDAHAPREKLAAAGRALTRFAFAEPRMFLAMNGPRIDAAGTNKNLKVAIAAVWRNVTDPIAELAQAPGSAIGNRVEAQAFFWGSLQGVLCQAILGRLKVARAEREAFFARLTERLISAL